MSETTEPVPQDGLEPAATETNLTPPETAATETPDEPKPKEDPAERRIARLTARLAAVQRESDAANTRLIEMQRAQQPPEQRGEPVPAEIDRLVEERATAKLAQREAQERVQRFHEAGRAAHADWQERCDSLIQMGADSHFADLLIDAPDGAKIAAALADDPDELERIAGIKTERGRALALGKYAALMDTKPAPTPIPKPVSKAPAPIKPITGAVKAEFNEATATTQQLVDHYAKQAARSK